MKTEIKNLIFDYGGVIMDIRPMTYIEEVIRLGATNIQEMHDAFMRDKVYRQFETGTLSPAGFRDLVRGFLPNHASDAELDHAWNLILGEIPPHRIEFLRSIRSRYRIFLLSNTNPVHYDFYQEYARKTYGLPSLDSLFDKAYFSFQIGMYKPDHDIFHFVLKDSGLKPEETAFIDDMKENVEASVECGIHGIHLTPGTEITDLNL